MVNPLRCRVPGIFTVKGKLEGYNEFVEVDIVVDGLVYVDELPEITVEVDEIPALLTMVTAQFNSGEKQVEADFQSLDSSLLKTGGVIYTIGYLQNYNTTVLQKIVIESVPVEKYGVTIGSMVNGSVSADKQTAAEGETVIVTVTPDEGYRLKADSLKMNDTVITENSFIMPNEDVTITAEFERITDTTDPTDPKNPTDLKNPTSSVKSPKTGDETIVFPLLLTMVIACATLGLLAFLRKKKGIS